MVKEATRKANPIKAQKERIGTRIISSKRERQRKRIKHFTITCCVKVDPVSEFDSFEQSIARYLRHI